MQFEILQGDKRTVLARLEEMAGQRAIYTRAPRFAYIIKGIAVERNGSVATQEDADLDLVQKLVDEGILQPMGDYTEEHSEEPAAVVQDIDAAVEPEITVMPTDASGETEDETACDAENDTDDEPDEDTCDGQAESEGVLDAEPTNQADDEPAGNMENDTEDGLDASDAEESEGAPDAEETQNGSGSPYDGLVERIESMRPSISFPLSKHRPESVRNLVFTIYSKGKLLSKATGGNFGVSLELVEALKAESLISTADVLDTIAEYGDGALRGLRFEDNRVVFDGFPETDQKEYIKAWTELCAAINKTAIKQYHVHAKQVEEVNEKFAFRTWMTRLGMNGPELKAERNLLYRNLSGHTAFRTPADEEKWKARQQAKRRELQANKESADSGEGAEG